MSKANYYKKIGARNYKENKLIADLNKKILENPNLANEIEPVNNFEELKRLHSKYYLKTENKMENMEQKNKELIEKIKSLDLEKEKITKELEAINDPATKLILEDLDKIKHQQNKIITNQQNLKLHTLVELNEKLSDFSQEIHSKLKLLGSVILKNCEKTDKIINLYEQKEIEATKNSKLIDRLNNEEPFVRKDFTDKMPKKKCNYCGEDFILKHRLQRYCPEKFNVKNYCKHSSKYDLIQSQNNGKKKK